MKKGKKSYISVNQGEVVYEDDPAEGNNTNYLTYWYGTSSSPHPVTVYISVGSETYSKIGWTDTVGVGITAPDYTDHAHSYWVDTSIEQTRQAPTEE